MNMHFPITVFKYKGSIHPHSDKAKSKGEVSVFSEKKGLQNFEFIAPNDETAMSYLNYFYKSEDKRELSGKGMLVLCKSEVETPEVWQVSIETCILIVS